MLARLWWKEYRVFGPVWLILVLAAGLLQWLFLTVNTTDVRSGALTVAALCWAVLYAFASGAAAFAGERESKTLGFLDALPVARGKLWLGKASFALVSTLALALVLAGMAALGTESRDPRERYAYGQMALVFGTLLFEALAWSLLWSSLSANPLLAGVMSVLSVFASAVLMERLAASGHLLASNDPVSTEAAPLRLLVAAAALAISGVVMTWKSRAVRKPRKRQTAQPAPIAIRTSSTSRSLVWQATREGWTTWLLVALVCLGIPLVSLLISIRIDGGLDVVLATLVSLVAGVNVFGTENASGARRFLVHHGVKPGTIWWRKLLVWGFAMGSIFGLMSLTFFNPWTPLGRSSNEFGQPAAIERFAILSVGYGNAFVVGLLCGMAIYRRMTAAMVGVIVMIAVAPAQLALVWSSTIPGWSLVFVPMIFLAATRAWAGDWLMEREGAWPWLRLAGLLAVPSGLLGVGFIAYRAYSVTDVGKVADPASMQAVGRPDEDAATWYRGAETLLDRGEAPQASETMANRVIEEGWDPSQADVVAWWKQNEPALDLARRTSLLPRGRFEDIGRMTFRSTIDPSVRNARTLGELLALDTRERLSRSDLAGAWDNIMAQFRMANQLATNIPTLARMRIATRIHHRAVGLAFDWLGAPGQSAELVRKALVDLKALPELPNLTETMRVEASIIERKLDSMAKDVAEVLMLGKNPSTLDVLSWSMIVAPSWERQRARRICRLLIAWELPYASIEPAQRPMITGRRYISGNEYLRGSTLARMMMPNLDPAIIDLDRELVGRRALLQAVAITAWKLEHDGAFPEKLEALVPSLLDRLPLDPYSGRPFGYVRSEGQAIRPPILDDFDTFNRLQQIKPGQPLLYSVGADRADDRGRTYFHSNGTLGDDYVYPVP